MLTRRTLAFAHKFAGSYPGGDGRSVAEENPKDFKQALVDATVECQQVFNAAMTGVMPVGLIKPFKLFTLAEHCVPSVN